MKPLERAEPVPVSRKKREMTIRLIREDAENRLKKKMSLREAIELYERNVGKDAEIWMNDIYTVYVHRDPGEWVHLSIKRNDREPVTDWRHKQQIKNELLGEECEAVELYPAVSRLVDSANQYHLWGCPDPTFRFPLGYKTGLLGTPEQAEHVGAKQRGYDE